MQISRNFAMNRCIVESIKITVFMERIHIYFGVYIAKLFTFLSRTYTPSGSSEFCYFCPVLFVVLMMMMILIRHRRP